MNSYLIKNGTVVNPINNNAIQADILVKNGRIALIDKNIISSEPVIDASNCIVTPGFVEIHAHFREPGYEGKETLDTGCEAALRGGYTTVCVMPNTNPALDKDYLVKYVKLRAKEINKINLEVIGAVSKGLAGEEMAELLKMKDSGAVAFSDDGKPIMNASLMLNALEYSTMIDCPIVVHEEDLTLSKNGVMNESDVSTELGLAGVSHLAEEIMIARDIVLAEATGAKLHIAHVSTAKSVELVREAKAKGVKVTCEVSPHHLTLTDKLLKTRLYDTNLKMSPPLRTDNDVKACLEGVIDGTIDAIATDHAPHKYDEKDVEFNYAPNGITGLETAFPVLYTHLVKTNKLDLVTLINKLTNSPAKVFNLPNGTLNINSSADISIINLNSEIELTENSLATKGKNTPWLHEKLFGEVQYVLKDGEVKYKKGEKND